MKLNIIEARYGWADNIWAPSSCSHDAGCKDVTSIIRKDAKNNRLHVNPQRKGQVSDVRDNIRSIASVLTIIAVHESALLERDGRWTCDPQKDCSEVSVGRRPRLCL